MRHRGGFTNNVDRILERKIIELEASNIKWKRYVSIAVWLRYPSKQYSVKPESKSVGCCRICFLKLELKTIVSGVILALSDGCTTGLGNTCTHIQTTLDYFQTHTYARTRLSIFLSLLATFAPTHVSYSVSTPLVAL